MFGWLKSKPKQPDRLVRLLADYPPFTPLHLGRNDSEPHPDPFLTLDQCRENLAQYIAAIPDRLDVLREVLTGLDIDMDLAYSDPLAFVTPLHRTLIVELPPLWRREMFKFDKYELSDRAGQDIGLSFMSDLAMLDVDVTMKAKPGCFLGLNLDPDDREMSSWRRPCLLGLTDRLFPNLTRIFYLEKDYFNYFANMDRPGRLTSPDSIKPVTYIDMIGGGLLIRLDRYIVAPDLDALLETTWLGEAA